MFRLPSFALLNYPEHSEAIPFALLCSLASFLSLSFILTKQCVVLMGSPTLLANQSSQRGAEFDAETTAITSEDDEVVDGGGKGG